MGDEKSRPSEWENENERNRKEETQEKTLVVYKIAIYFPKY